MRKYLIIVLATIVLLIHSDAKAQSYYIASGASGDCSISNPCGSMQQAINLCPSGGYCHLSVASGWYDEKVNIFYYKVISITGNCANRSDVVIWDGSQAGNLFHVQDHAILTISCMTIVCYLEGSIGFASRQYAIGDINNVNFAPCPLGVAANESSKINISNPGIYGGGSRWAYAADNSLLTIGGNVIANGPVFNIAFLSALFGSVVTWSANFSGSLSGYNLQCNDSIVKNSAQLPTMSGPYPGNIDCKMR